jgi:uncharacterized protein (DUF1697 family)
MSVLREAFESLGFSGVATFLGSGNVVFETRAKDIGKLEKKIGWRLQEALGYNVPVFVRTRAELNEVAAFEPCEASKIQGVDVNVILLASNLDPKSKAKLLALGTETDAFMVRGREIFWWRRKKPGTSLFSTVPLAKVLRAPFTIRSTNTIRKLVTRWP